MQIRHFSFVAAVALAAAGCAGAAQAATSDFSAKHKHARYHHHARSHVTVYPRNAYGWENGYGSGPGGYPAHSVPLAAYPNPGGIGLTWAPYGWNDGSYRRDGGWR